MQILVGAILVALLILIVSRFVGGRQGRMLEQYELLEKRFGFKRRVVPSKWGKGIGERVSLAGEYRGYPVSLYDHFHGEGKDKVEWTTLAFETLFAGELEMRVVFEASLAQARFSALDNSIEVLAAPNARMTATSEQLGDFVGTDRIRERLSKLGAKEGCGAISLSKGFLEYRELGKMTDDATRERFQDALLLLGDLADEISVFAAKQK